MADSIRGLVFPLRFGPLGHMERAVGSDKLKSNIRMIILTAVGERHMAFKFGTIGTQAVFRNLDGPTFTLVQDLFRDALAKHETRIRVLTIEAKAAQLEGKMEVTINFVVKSTGAFDDLVLLLPEGTS